MYGVYDSDWLFLLAYPVWKSQKQTLKMLAIPIFVTFDEKYWFPLYFIGKLRGTVPNVKRPHIIDQLHWWNLTDKIFLNLAQNVWIKKDITITY